MKLTERNIRDIDELLFIEKLYRHEILVRIEIDNRIEEELVFESRNSLISALMKLKGYEFKNAMNRQIGIVKGNKWCSLYLSQHNVEYAKDFGEVL